MTTFAIGDVHGCYDELRDLLRAVGWRRRRDRLVFAGDLVNNGPRSLDVLRFVTDLGEGAASVLGNHDLKLLAVHRGVRERTGSETFHDVLDAADADALVGWLAARPFLIEEEATGHVVVHAGLHPTWTLDEARRLATRAAKLLRSGGADADALLQPSPLERPPDDGAPAVELAFASSVFTRMRTLRVDGALDGDVLDCDVLDCDVLDCDVLDWGFKGSLGELPDDLVPWFRRPHPRPDDLTVVFGHWSALGVLHEPGARGLDSGCVWGRELTALDLQTGRLVQVPRRR